MNLGDRMKAYESAWKITFPPRMPIILRIDGKAFHTFTKGYEKPFDWLVAEWMLRATKALMDQVQGATIGYTQSDETSLFLHTYNKFDSESWFSGNKGKIETVATSIFTEAFNSAGTHKPAHFDCRAFVLPKEEVYNYFLWRERDCERNAISAFGRHKFGHEKCHGKSTTHLCAMFDDKEWNDVPEAFKHGTYMFQDNALTRGLIDGESQTLIEELVNFQEEE